MPFSMRLVAQNYYNPPGRSNIALCSWDRQSRNAVMPESNFVSQRSRNPPVACKGNSVLSERTLKAKINHELLKIRNVTKLKLTHLNVGMVSKWYNLIMRKFIANPSRQRIE